MRTHLGRLSLLLAWLLALPAAAQTLTIHFLDVGQGDAALIKTAEGRTVLIDAGPPEAGDSLARRVATLTSGPIDLLILSHPHLDHLGGFEKVLEKVGAKRYLEPGFEHATGAYTSLLEALVRHKVEVRTTDRDPAQKDEPLEISLGGGAKLTVVWPQRPLHPFLTDTRSDPNANSIVARLTYGDHSVLFTGDAEPETEAQFMKLGTDLQADVLKVGHHGSRFSSTTPFLRRIKPQLAVISCGKDNRYGHPAPDTMDRLEAVGARVVRTDVDGEITLRINASGISMKTTKAPTETLVVHPLVSGGARAGAVPASALVDESREVFVASKRSKVFHKADCGAVEHIKKSNLVHFTTREAAMKTKRPAKDCRP